MFFLIYDYYYIFLITNIYILVQYKDYEIRFYLFIFFIYKLKIYTFYDYNSFFYY